MARTKRAIEQEDIRNAAKRRNKIQAEDGSWVPRSFYGGSKRSKEQMDVKRAAARRRKGRK